MRLELTDKIDTLYVVLTDRGIALLTDDYDDAEIYSAELRMIGQRATLWEIYQTENRLGVHLVGAREGYDE